MIFLIVFAICLPFFDLDAVLSNPRQDILTHEIAMLDDLIEVSQQSLEAQKHLRKLIQEYQVIQTKYLENAEDNELLFQMIKTAHAILEQIKEYRLTQYFDPAFISEILLISKPANKLSIPKP